MYESFYGLSSKPFQLNPDPSFYFNSKQHRRAKAYLEYGVMRNEGFIVITGEIGAGKTTVLAGLLNGLDSRKVVVGQLVTTQLGAEDTLRMVSAAFGVRLAGSTKSELLISLEAFLVKQASLGKRCLLVVDEAQNLSPRAVEELRMLSNYQLGTQSLLQSFLVGQPEFREILQRPEMEQFRQRIAATCHIGPLDLDDTRQYIEHRLKCAGATQRLVTDPAAFQSIFNASHGIPRRINSLCDRLLLLGYLGSKRELGVEDVEEVVSEFRREAGAPSSAAAVHGANGTSPAAAPIVAAAAQSNGVDATEEAARLERLEQAVQRVERLNAQTLALVQRLVTLTQA